MRNRTYFVSSERRRCKLTGDGLGDVKVRVLNADLVQAEARDIERVLAVPRFFVNNNNNNRPELGCGATTGTGSTSAAEKSGSQGRARRRA